MTIFFVSVAVVLGVSALCSLTEAAIYAVRIPFIRQLTESGSRAGELLSGFKKNMERPISAILIVNTAANTAGAAVAGAQARVLFGEVALWWFSIAFTLGVLFFSEIIPKILGVVYNRPVARVLALPLNAVIWSLYPVIWFVQRMSRYLKPTDPVLAAPEDEVQQFAQLSAEEGSILPIEAALIQNVLRLNEIDARDIMTPRTVVLKLPAEMTLRDAVAKVKEWNLSRVPIYSEEDPDTWVGFVMSRDILVHLAKNEFDTKLHALAKPIYFVPEQAAGHLLLKEFLKRRSHLFGVVDEYGGITGVVTLEDVLESLLGEEIVDEVDAAVDMQELARLRGQESLGRIRTEDKSNDNDSESTSATDG